jgi:hypothetical protein
MGMRTCVLGSYFLLYIFKFCTCLGLILVGFGCWALSFIAFVQWVVGGLMVFGVIWVHTLLAGLSSRVAQNLFVLELS